MNEKENNNNNTNNHHHKTPLKAQSINSPTKTVTQQNKSKSIAETNDETGLTNNKQVVLTHFIDGYVIKESSKPFPVKSSNSNKQAKNDNKNNSLVGSSSPPKSTSTPSSSSNNKYEDSFVSFNCLQCGISSAGSRKKVYNQNSLCSSVCMKRYNKKKRQSSTSNDKKSSKKTHSDETNNNNDSMISLRSNKDRFKNMPPATNESDEPNSHKHHKTSKHHHKNDKKSSSKKHKDKSRNENNNEMMDVSMNNNNSIMPPPASLLPFGGSPQLNIQSSPQFSTSSPTLLINHNINNSNNNSNESYPMGDPADWNCDEVYQFVKLVAGIQIAQLFKSQEVDGSALTLIRDDHLVNTMQIKLGPALKIMSKFNELKSKYNNALCNNNQNRQMIQT